MNKTVIVFGTFDIFHPGHKDFIAQAKKLGDYLIVCVARDQTVEAVKGRHPLHNEIERAKTILTSKLADKVVLGNIKDKYAVIRKYCPDVIALGYDQNNFIEQLPQILIESGLRDTKIIKLKPYKPEIYKSSKLAKNL